MRKMMIVSALLLSACGPSPDQISQAVQETMAVWTVVPSQTAMPTYTSAPTLAVEVTRVVTREVTPTSTSTPLFTPTDSQTPTITSTPTVTPNAAKTATARVMAKLTSPKGDGFYLVGVDIAPGVWRSTGTADNCYWQTSAATGGIVANHFGMSGGTAYVSASAFQVEFENCGTWTYLSPP